MSRSRHDHFPRLSRSETETKHWHSETKTETLKNVSRDIQLCFKCNCFGHVTSKCKNTYQCSRCGGEYTRKTCENDQKCVNCGGNRSAASKICPQYAKEAEIIKIIVTNKISYAEACKQVKNASVTKPASNQSQSLNLLRPPAAADKNNFFPFAL